MKCACAMYQWNGNFVLPTRWYKTTILHNLINHNANLSDLWLRKLEHNSFQTRRKLSESTIFNNYLCKISKSKIFNNYLCKYQLISNIIVNTFLSKYKGVKCLNYQIFTKKIDRFFLKKNVNIDFKRCEFFQEQ